MNLLRMFAVAVMSVALVAPAASAQTPATTGYDATGVLPQIPPPKDVVPPPQQDVLGENRQGGAEDKLPTGKAPSVAAVPNVRTDAPVKRETGAAPPVKSGTLPFTGLDVGIVALLGLMLVGTGFALRRSRTPRTR